MTFSSNSVALVPELAATCLSDPFYRSGSGMEVKGSPIRKWDGQSADRSEGSEDIGIKGLEFIHASI